MNASSHRGSIMLLVIVFGGIFFMLLTALSSFVLAQSHVQDVTRQRAEAFNLAEAGVNYYRWFLSHFPGNTTDNTGHAGPYVTTMQDPEGGTAGTYSLSITGHSACGVVQSIDVSSTGVPADAPNVSATIDARYAAPSVARYNMILNAGVWFGGGPLYGAIHSNNGIRMDGQPNAPVTSSVSTWDCTASYGCNPSQTEPGVFGSGTNKSMWKYPTPQIDFAAISSNFSTEKSLAQSSGLYFPRVSLNSKGKDTHTGYHLIFNGDNTVSVYQVTSVAKNVYSIPADGSTNYQYTAPDYSVIAKQTFLGTYPIPSSCSLIFVEDNTWIGGTISGKVTVVAANVTTTGVSPNIYIPDSLTYTTDNGADGLTAIASHNVLIAANAPSNLTLDGIFVAQSGVFGMNLYLSGTYAYKNSLTMYGTSVSTLRPVTYWTYQYYGWSGYPYGSAVFDRQNSIDPPPFTPTTSPVWQIINWRQQ